ncbi:MAG TPA: glutamyl-tRNA reductase [Candidatus Obscuribacterales bacterium]
MQLLLVGVNYKSAGLAAREPLSFDAPIRQQILARLSGCPQIQELVLLSTCNRTEVYAIVSQPLEAREAIVSELCAQAGMPVTEWEDMAYTFYNKFAATQLFEVASGLDSMVLGENEILRQVKDALEAARQAGSCGPVLDQLLRFAITAGKRVRSETSINEGCASIGALAARLVRESLGPEARLLVLGAGQIARVLVRNLAKSGLELLIANRTAANAEALALDYPGPVQVLGLEQISAVLPQVDAVVACASISDYLIGPAQLAGRDRPLLLIDLAVPRNLDPELAGCASVSLYDVDSLQQVVRLSLEQRSRYVEQAQTIIGEETTRFLEWFHQRDLVPTIRSLYEMFEEVRQRELERGLQKYRDDLAPETEALIERVTKAITQKILHYPVVRLKNAPAAEQQLYDRVLSELFGLNSQDGIDKYVHLPESSRTRSPS